MADDPSRSPINHDEDDKTNSEHCINRAENIDDESFDLQIFDISQLIEEKLRIDPLSLEDLYGGILLKPSDPDYALFSKNNCGEQGELTLDELQNLLLEDQENLLRMQLFSNIPTITPNIEELKPPIFELTANALAERLKLAQYTAIVVICGDDVVEDKYSSSDLKATYEVVMRLVGRKVGKRHKFVKLLKEKQMLLRNYTESVDMRDRLVGLEDDDVVHVNGSLFSPFICSDCKLSDPMPPIEIAKRKEIRKCECGGMIRPNVVFEGEHFSNQFFQKFSTDFKECDLLIMIGSELREPFDGLIGKVGDQVPRLLINEKRVGCGYFGDERLRLGMMNNYRDIEMLGPIDLMLDEFISMLGWELDFQKIEDNYVLH